MKFHHCDSCIWLDDHKVTYPVDFKNHHNYQEIVKKLNQRLEQGSMFHVYNFMMNSMLYFGDIRLRKVNQQHESQLIVDSVVLNSYLKPKESTMRVQFVLNLDQLIRSSGRYGGNQENRHEAINWIGPILGLSVQHQHQLHCGQNAKIDCSAEQFVRFQLERCRRGYINRFRDLRAKVITDPPYKDVDLPLFVSGKDELLESISQDFVILSKAPPTLDDVILQDAWTEIDLTKYSVVITSLGPQNHQFKVKRK